MEAEQQKGVKYILYCSYLHLEVFSLLHHAKTLGLGEQCLTNNFPWKYCLHFQYLFSHMINIYVVKVSSWSIFPTFSPRQNQPI